LVAILGQMPTQNPLVANQISSIIHCELQQEVTTGGYAGQNFF
jgi:hypothetical protein